MDIMKQDKNMERIDKGWQEMHNLLDDKMPQQKKRRRFIFLWFFLSAAIIITSIAMNKYGENKTNNPIQNNTVVGLSELENKNITSGKNIINSSDKNSIEQLKSKLTENITDNNNNNNNNNNKLNNTDNSDITKANSPELKYPKTKKKNSTSTNDQTNNSNINRSPTSRFSNVLEAPNEKSNEKVSGLERKKEVEREGILHNLNLGEPSNNINLNSAKKSNSIKEINQFALKDEENSIFEIDPIKEIKSLPIINRNQFLEHDYQPIIISDNHFIEPLISVNKKSTELNFGLMASTDYYTNLNIIGYAPRAFIEFESNKKWGLGFEIKYSFAERDTDINESRNGIILDMEDLEIDIPAGLEDQNSTVEILEDEKRGEVLNAYTTNLNSIGLGMYSFVNIGSKIRLSLGLSIDEYSGHKTLNNVYVSNEIQDLSGVATADPTLSTYLFSKRKLILHPGIGINYQITNGFDINVNYKHALSNLVSEGDTEINTNRLSLGLSFSF